MTNRKKDAPIKENKVGRLLQVQELIDFFVLAEILDVPRYQVELDDRMVRHFDGIGVNLSYMSQRIRVMREKGQLETYWDNDVKRTKLYCRITNQGREYFTMMLRDIPMKVQDALKFYKSMESYVDQFSKWDVTK